MKIQCYTNYLKKIESINVATQDKLICGINFKLVKLTLYSCMYKLTRLGISTISNSQDMVGFNFLVTQGFI